MVRSAAEEADIPFQLFDGENNKIRHHVKMHIFQQITDFFFVVHIHAEGFGSFGQRMVSPVEQVQFPVFFQAALADCIGDCSRAADKQRFFH